MSKVTFVNLSFSMNREILNCLDKITNASRKQSSQSVRKEEDNSFSNLHLKGIWGEENKDDSGTFKMKFDHLKKKKVQRPVVKTKFSNKESKLENLNEKVSILLNKNQFFSPLFFFNLYSKKFLN